MELRGMGSADLGRGQLQPREWVRGMGKADEESGLLPSLGYSAPTVVHDFQRLSDGATESQRSALAAEVPALLGREGPAFLLIRIALGPPGPPGPRIPHAPEAMTARLRRALGAAA